MSNEIELRLECIKLAVEITPTSMYPQQNKILANADIVLEYVTKNGEITFQSREDDHSMSSEIKADKKTKKKEEAV